MMSKHLLTVISDRVKPLTNLLQGQPVLATFQVTLRCNSACGYCDLPLNQGRYELSRDEIRSIFGNLYTEGIRFVLVQGGEPLLRPDLVEVLQDLSVLGLHLTLISKRNEAHRRVGGSVCRAQASLVHQHGYAELGSLSPDP